MGMGGLLRTIDQSRAANSRDVKVRVGNEKTPVFPGFESSCGLVRRPDHQEPPKGLEPSTYALRKPEDSSSKG